MARKDMKKALGASLKAEEQAVRDRFEKAETVLSRSSKTASHTQTERNGRVVRDSFTMPSADYDLIPKLKKRYMKSSGAGVTKSELLRAGLTALEAMTDRELTHVIESLAKVKTGRPTS
jgi:hypothetical protein